MSCVYELSILISENIGWSLASETSHFLNGSIHHSEISSGGKLSKSLTFFKIPSTFKTNVFVEMSCSPMGVILLYTFMSHKKLRITTEVQVNITLTSLALTSSSVCCCILYAKHETKSPIISILRSSTVSGFKRPSAELHRPAPYPLQLHCFGLSFGDLWRAAVDWVLLAQPPAVAFILPTIASVI